ncbi:hypothetical protein M9458_034055, partial [Cirrhinus mrigala]
MSRHCQLTFATVCHHTDGLFSAFDPSRCPLSRDNTRSEFNTTVWNLTASVQEE